jgi:hypothetical protein
VLLSLLKSHSSCASEHSGPCMNECAPNLKASGAQGNMGLNPPAAASQALPLRQATSV